MLVFGTFNQELTLAGTFLGHCEVFAKVPWQLYSPPSAWCLVPRPCVLCSDNCRHKNLLPESCSRGREEWGPSQHAMATLPEYIHTGVPIQHTFRIMPLKSWYKYLGNFSTKTLASWARYHGSGTLGLSSLQSVPPGLGWWTVFAKPSPCQCVGDRVIQCWHRCIMVFIHNICRRWPSDSAFSLRNAFTSILLCRM